MLVSKTRLGCLELLLLSSCSCEGLWRAGLIWNWAAMFDRRLMSPQTKCLLPGVSLWAGSQARCTVWWKESGDVLPCEGTRANHVGGFTFSKLFLACQRCCRSQGEYVNVQGAEASKTGALVLKCVLLRST